MDFEFLSMRPNLFIFVFMFVFEFGRPMICSREISAVQPTHTQKSVCYLTEPIFGKQKYTKEH